MKNEHIKKSKDLLSVGSAFLIKIAGTGFSFITSIIISRNFSSAGIGIYSLSNSILSICAILAKCGFDISIIKYASINYANGKHGNIKLLIQNTLAVSVVIACLLASVVMLSSDLLADIFHKADLGDLLRIMIWVLLPSTIIQLIASAFKGTGKVQIGLIFESVIINAAFSLALLIQIFILKNVRIEGLGYAYLVGTLVIGCIVVTIWKVRSRELNRERDDSYSFYNVIKTSMPLLLVNSTNYILSSTDILMIGLWLSASEVGLYNIATKITLFSSMLLSAINAMLGPRFAVLYANNNIEGLSKLVKKSSRLMLMASIVVFSVFVVSAKWILSIWGKEFISGASVLYISLIGQFFVLATGPLATVLMMCGFEKIHRNNTIFCAVLNIVLNYILIQTMGINGAAVATAASLVVKNVYCVYAVKKKLGFYCY